MRQEAEGLEHHAHLGAAHVDELFFGHGHDVLSVDLDNAAGYVVKTGKTAHQRGLARTGQAHDDQHFAARDIDRNVLDPGNVAVPPDCIEAMSVRHRLQVGFRIGAEQFPYIAAGDDSLVFAHDFSLSIVEHHPGSKSAPPG